MNAFTQWYALHNTKACAALLNCTDYKTVDAWLYTAFRAGATAEVQRSHLPKEYLVTQQEIAALCSGSAGWMDAIETK